MAGKRPSSRKRILDAAAELARQGGPVRFSLEAVASRAGVSKGGLLYNFPTKASLMQALVEEHLVAFSEALDAATGTGEPLLSAYVRLAIRESEKAKPAPSWIFAAMAEDPDFLKPIVAFQRRLLERLRAEATDPTGMLVAFLVIEGMRSMKLFGADVLTPDEQKAVSGALIAGARPAPASRRENTHREPVS